MKKIILVFAIFLAFLELNFGQFALLKEINPGNSSSIATEKGAMAQMGNVLFFSANTASNGVELWKTDGTPAGTVMIKDINPGTADSDPDHFFVLGNQMFFTANDGVVGRELWITDGTESGTILLADIRPGASSAFESFFLTLDFRDFYVFQNHLFFRAYTSTDGLELYKSDGTPAGTGLVKSISPGANDGCQGDFAVLNGELYFVGFTSNYGGEIWKTDGTGSGTVAVTTTLNTTPEDLTVLGNHLIFIGDDGVSGREPWISDGTEMGTILLKDTDPSPGSGGLSHDLLTPERRFFVSGTKAYFSVRDAQYDSQVWVTNGTPGGTIKLKSIGSSNCVASNFVQLGNNVLFTGCDFEDSIWKTTGTPASTQIIQTYGGSPFSTGSFHFPLLHAHDAHVWYSAGDFNPYVLYNTDGTSINTKPVDAFPENYLEPQRFFSFGKKMLFWAKTNNSDDNLEPYIYQPSLAVSGTVTAVKCAGGSDGSILLQTSGIPPFMTAWLPSSVSGLNPSGLPVGFYFVTVTDAEGTTGTAIFQVTQPSAISASFSTTPQMGASQNGTATANPSGGTPPYQYSWNTSPIQTNQTATGLVQGTYSCMITDANGCVFTDSVVINFVVGTNALTQEYKISLAPNPAGEWISIQWGHSTTGVKTYRLFDANGTLVRVFNNPPHDRLSLEGLSNGLKIVEILVDNVGYGSLLFIKM
jgi:ELWxxDGT repeat protein